MRKAIILLMLALTISFTYGAVAERTKEICEDLNISGVYIFQINSTFSSQKEAELVFVKELPFKKFNIVNRPLDFYEAVCGGKPYTCTYPQLGITITSGVGIIINCSHEGPSNEEAKQMWIEKHEEEIRERNMKTVLGVTFLIVLVALLYFLPSLEKERKKEKMLENWIKENIKKGYTKEWLKNYLVRRGYDERKIEKIISRLK